MLLLIRPLLPLLVSVLATCAAGPPGAAPTAALSPVQPAPAAAPLRMGAEQLEKYLPQLQNQRVGLVVNQTSRVGRAHLVDTLLARGVNVAAIFAPEHGFRGEAADGATIKDGRDERSGRPVRSLYGKSKKPTPAMLADVDVLVFDIQDVGARFYTFISTLHYVMEAAAELGKPVLVLDRPNPNGAFVDGPVLEKAHRSFVGLDPLPIVHGLTVGELARMLNGEKWLAGGAQCRLTVVSVAGAYTHATPYALPVRPSPNLPTARSVALYPSICLFEGTNVSVGRGTDTPFEVFGAPTQPATRPYSFTPRPNAGSPTPPLNGQLCHGLNLRPPAAGEPQGLTLKYLIDFYQQSTDKAHFFSKYFAELSGTDSLQAQIVAGRTEAQIRPTWEPGLNNFKKLRKKYLLYPEK
ncbi:exo-beta-N-acetylmuramidase NamZ domain-containing protein [uncultured Hymenobacter sp.]|uniref:exo-beta-N-acetylmuramidase NamZ family protein n=1 Tax=uncultured Hymenobacter sp. TaxID=170016 RepID=UPI0035CBE3AB